VRTQDCHINDDDDDANVDDDDDDYMYTVHVCTRAKIQ